MTRQFTWCLAWYQPNQQKTLWVQYSKDVNLCTSHLKLTTFQQDCFLDFSYSLASGPHQELGVNSYNFLLTQLGLSLEKLLASALLVVKLSFRSTFGRWTAQIQLKGNQRSLQKRPGEVLYFVKLAVFYYV